MITPLSGTVCHLRLGLVMISPHYEDMNGNEKCRNWGGMSPFDRAYDFIFNVSRDCVSVLYHF